MKLLLYILLFLAFSANAQQSNSPEVVFPMVEKFIAEAHQHQVPVYHKIREIDSIAIEKLPHPFSGLHIVSGTYESITIHKDPRRTRRSIEKSFYHEVGEAFGLKHTWERRKIMNTIPNDPWFENETNWQKAKDEFFNALKSIP